MLFRSRHAVRPARDERRRAPDGRRPSRVPGRTPCADEALRGAHRDLSPETLEYLDKMGLTADKINSLNTGYKKLDSAIISKDRYQARVTNMLEDLANSGGDIETTIHMKFDDILNGLDEKK